MSAGLRDMMKAESPRVRVKSLRSLLTATKSPMKSFFSSSGSTPNTRLKCRPAARRTGGVRYLVAASAYCSWQYKRLPTEAEWEYAAQGGQAGERISWGSDPPTPERANYSASKVNGPVRVGTYPPNGYGLYDMAGNVWEWTADNWRDRHDAPIVQGPGAQSDSWWQFRRESAAAASDVPRQP